MPKSRRPRDHRRCVVPHCRRHPLPGRACCHDHRRSRACRAAQTALARLATDLTLALTPPPADAVSLQPRPAGAAPSSSPQPWPAGAAPSSSPQDWGAGGAFRDRLHRGDYAALLDEPLAALVEQAADRYGLADELGALRLLLTRLLADNLAAADPARHARTVAHLATAAARVARTHHLLTGGETEDTSELALVIAQLDAEREARRAGHALDQPAAADRADPALPSSSALVG